MGFEPVFALSLIKNNLQCSQTQRDQAEADVIDPGFGKLLPLQVRRVLDETRSQHERKYSDRNVQQKNPPPGEVIGDPSTERRPDGGGEHYGKAIDRKSHATFSGRKCVSQDCLLARL